MTIVCLVLTGCLLATGSDSVAEPGGFNGKGGNNSLLMEDGITVKKLTKAIHEAVANNPKDLKIKAESSSQDKSTIWLYSEN